MYYEPAAGGGADIKTVSLAPGQSWATGLTAQQRSSGVATVACRAGVTAYGWSGGPHGNSQWTGAGGYECRKG